jgi:hypothetical protein
MEKERGVNALSYSSRCWVRKGDRALPPLFVRKFFFSFFFRDRKIPVCDAKAVIYFYWKKKNVNIR